jgi:hypothetical protein
MSEEQALEQDNATVADQPMEESPPVENTAPEQEVASTVDQPVPATPEQPSVWNAFRSLPDFKGQEDSAIAQSLYETMERERGAQKALAQYQQLIPYANEYLRHRDDFETFLSTRNGQVQQQSVTPVQQPAEEKSWWNPPELKDNFKRFLVRDENGREVVSEDAPPEARLAIEDFMQYRADFAQKFLSNPEEALGPMVEKVASQRAQEILENTLSQRDNETYVNSLEQDNADWLYETDGKTPTQEGLAVQRYIEQASQLGIQDPHQRWEYATSMVERDLLVQIKDSDERQAAIGNALSQPVARPVAEQQPEIPQNQAEQDIDYLRREASRNPSRSKGSSDPRTPQQPMTFEQRLKSQLAKDNLI